MSRYVDLLEQRTALKAEKERLFNLIGKKKDIEEIDKQISKLSIEIRSLETEGDNSWFPDIEYVKKPPITPLDYKTFCEFYKDTVVASINDQLNSIEVPIGVYAIFKNAVVQSEHYIMKHHYNIYCSEVKESNQWIIHK